jgi:hypothetical protein
MSCCLWQRLLRPRGRPVPAAAVVERGAKDCLVRRYETKGGRNG